MVTYCVHIQCLDLEMAVSMVSTSAMVALPPLMTQDRLCALRLRAKWPGHPDSFSPGLFTWPSQETLRYWGLEEFQQQLGYDCLSHWGKLKVDCLLCWRRLLFVLCLSEEKGAFTHERITCTEFLCGYNTRIWNVDAFLLIDVSQHWMLLSVWGLRFKIRETWDSFS